MIYTSFLFFPIMCPLLPLKFEYLSYNKRGLISTSNFVKISKLWVAQPLQYLVSKHWNMCMWGREEAGKWVPGPSKDMKWKLKLMGKAERDTSMKKNRVANSTFCLIPDSLCAQAVRNWRCMVTTGNTRASVEKCTRRTEPWKQQTAVASQLFEFRCSSGDGDWLWLFWREANWAWNSENCGLAPSSRSWCQGEAELSSGQQEPHRMLQAKQFGFSLIVRSQPEL